VYKIPAGHFITVAIFTSVIKLQAPTCGFDDFYWLTTRPGNIKQALPHYAV